MPTGKSLASSSLCQRSKRHATSAPRAVAAIIASVRPRMIGERNSLSVSTKRMCLCAPGVGRRFISAVCVLVPRTVITDFSASFAQLQHLRARLVRSAPGLTSRELRLTLMPSAERGERDLVGALRIADGSFVTFRLSPYLGAPPDPRLGEAVELLRSKRRADGRWRIEYKYSGRVFFDMEKGGAPSRWNTLRALRILRWWGA